MILVLGIGNFDAKYQMTRHSVGIYFLQRYIQYIKKNEKWKDEKDGKDIYWCTADNQIYFAYAKTYMNLAKNSLYEFVKDNKMPETLIVVHDEIDLPFGKIKVTKSMRDNGHKGVRSLKALTNKSDLPVYLHFRYGVDKISGPKLIDYLLSQFTKDEMQSVKTTGFQKFFLLSQAIAEHKNEELDLIIEKWRNSC